MSQKSSAEIRQEFINFFTQKQHLKVPSAPVVPQNDPTLLFTNAGMNQFKPICDKDDGLPVDQESIDLWQEETSINPDHILKFDKTDNFWEMGSTGPCGPCSEVHVDIRPDEERQQLDGAELVNMDDPRVMEIWNLVFIQFNRQTDGSLEKLPAQHVDTGMGFERICAILQDKKSNYDTDLFAPLLNKIGELADVSYGDNEEIDIAMRVIADHIRAVSFSIADGASPGNDGRGYVVRRILRRAIRYGWDKLDLKEPFFHKLVPTLAEQFNEVFPVLVQQQDYVENVIRSEEQSFLNTLGQGIELFNEMIEGKDEISGEDAFKLHDTYGFPIDLTQLMARERGVEVDEEGFNKRMQEQKERARAAGKFNVDQSSQKEWITVTDTNEFSFVGYDSLSAQTNIKALRKDDEQNAIILEKTPFYAESGGQVADTGIISDGEQHLRVLDVQKSSDGYIHFVDQLPDDPSGEWEATVDADRRREIKKHHSATHLVHAALKKVLGDHVQQKGSLVDEKHLRFDFSHFEQITPKELQQIEEIVNDRIQQNITKQEERGVPIDEAKERGATMLFGEKYGDQVRVITFDPDYSMELCGGTHVDATGEIGYFRFLSESSAAAGIRRIEAKVGKSVDQYLRSEQQLVQDIRAQIGQSSDIVRDINQLIEERKELEKAVERLQHQQSASKLDELLENAQELDSGIKLVSGEVPNADMDLLKQLGYESLEKSSKGTVTVLGAKNTKEGKVYVMAAVSDNLIHEKGLKAGALVGELGKMLGGGGGGQPNLATAGGGKPEKLNEVFDKLPSIISSHLD